MSKHPSRPAPPKTTAPAPPISRAKRSLFFAVLFLCLPLLLLLALEGSLRLFGYGGYPPVLLNAGPVNGGSLIISDQAGAISYFFANRSRPGYNDQYHFHSPKPPGVFRVFLVGESAAKGYPQPRNLASSAFLQEMLGNARPNRKIEVINLGTTAVASFPVLGTLTEALDFEPDLVIIHTGHNEFFGAYGVNSISRGGAGLLRLKTTRFARSLAIVQAINHTFSSRDPVKGRTLMEIMAARSYVAPDDPLRRVAADNLAANVAEMLSRCRDRGVPAIVCSLPTNERDLHPIGEDRLEDIAEPHRLQFQALMDQARTLQQENPREAARVLAEAITIAPRHAGARFELGGALFKSGLTNEARLEFVHARDLDTMPWRATSLQQEALRQAAARSGAWLCDMEDVFRTNSPGGCIGWELMDDHVHPTLRGQALMAEAIVGTLARSDGPVAIDTSQAARIRPWKEYAAELGENRYDQYAVDHSMRILFSIGFMRESNPEAARRFNEKAAAFEAEAGANLRETLREWQSETPHAGGKRPLTGMVARQLMREKRYAEALDLYRIAQRSVPEYTSWHLEYVYFTLVCRELLSGGLSDEDRALALKEIGQADFLLRRGFSQTGLTERYAGRLHQLRGEFEEAIRYLNASRAKLGGFDLVAADQALFTSLLKTGRSAEARKLAENGIAHSGQYTSFYKQMLDVLNGIPQPPRAVAE